MWHQDCSPSIDHHHIHQSSEPASPQPSSVVALPSSTLPANLISRPAAYTIGTKSRSFSNDTTTGVHHHHQLPLHRKSTSISSNASSTGTAGTGTSTSRVTFADQVAFPPGQNPDLLHLDDSDESTMASLPTYANSPLAVNTFASPETADSDSVRSTLEPSQLATMSTLSSSPTALKRHQLGRASSLQRVPTPLTGSESTSESSALGPASPPSATKLQNRRSLTSLNLGRKSSLPKKSFSTPPSADNSNTISNSTHIKQTDRDRDSVPPSPSSAHRGQRHVMLNRRSVSQDFQIRLQQQQQRQEELGDELSEAGEDVPGTPSSISSYGSATTPGRQN
ncbi:hypothetical protein BGZ94_009898, partial [Podila epigama]